MTPAPARRRRGRPPASDAAALPASPTLVLVGEESRAQAIADALQGLRLRLQLRESLEALWAGWSDETVALLLVAGGAVGRPQPALRALGSDRRSADLPLFAVVDDDWSDRRMHALYQAGATGVFAWPREALLLPRVLLEQLSLAPDRASHTAADRALARAAAARFRLVEGGAGVRTAAWNGILHLSGRVESLRVRRSLEQLAAVTPGVRGVVAEALEVAGQGRSDAEIARNLRALLAGHPGCDTVSVAVIDGRATLMGSVRDPGELGRIAELLGHVRGVRSIIDQTRVSPPAQARDSRTARGLQRQIDGHFPEARVRVAILGDSAVLRGTAPYLAVRAEIERLVRARRPGLSRVIDRIEVVGPDARPPEG